MQEYIKGDSCIEPGLTDKTKILSPILPLFAGLVTGGTSWQQDSGGLWLYQENVRWGRILSSSMGSHCQKRMLWPREGRKVPRATQQAHLRPTTISEERFPRPARGRGLGTETCRHNLVLGKGNWAVTTAWQRCYLYNTHLVSILGASFQTHNSDPVSSEAEAKGSLCHC